MKQSFRSYPVSISRAVFVVFFALIVVSFLVLDILIIR